MAVIALHGWGGTPLMIIEDIGNLGVPFYAIDSTDICEVKKHIKEVSIDGMYPVSLIGYSKGCAIIADISVTNPSWISRAVLYEGPLGKLGSVGGTFPACLIWNKKGRGNWKAAIEATEAWKANGRRVVELEGKGRHTKVDMSKTPRRRHGWDRKLNSDIAKFLRGELL